MNEKPRCTWCNLNNPKYIEYHDNEWCQPNFDDKYLYEMLILESFQAGLSWECVLNKRESFRLAYDNFDIEKVCLYDEQKMQDLLNKARLAYPNATISAKFIEPTQSRARELNFYAETNQTDLIVVKKSNRMWLLNKLLFASTAQNLVFHAETALLVI